MGSTSRAYRAIRTSRPSGLLLNLQEHAVGVDGSALRCSWIVPMLGDAQQRSYRLQIAEDSSCADPLWDSGRVLCADSTGVLIQNIPMEASTPYWWRVQVDTSASGDWSLSAPFTTAPFATGPFTTVPSTTAPSRWPAAPIWAGDSAAWALLRTEIDLPATPIRAAFMEAVGLSPEGGPGGAEGPRGGRQHVYKLWANGQVTGFGSVRSQDEHPRLHTHHLADLLRPGRNALAALAWAQDGRQFAARLVVVLEDGTRIEHATSPKTWRALPGDHLLPGERSIGGGWYHAPAEDWDLREEPVGWTSPGFDDTGWAAASAAPALPAPPAPAIVNLGQADGDPVRLEPAGPETWRFDLGREIVGGLRVRCLASDGAQLEVRLGEQRDADEQVISSMPTGNVYEETWTLRGGEQEVEHWGYRAFRYGELRALSGEIENLQVTPMILSSGTGRAGGTGHTGTFASSDPDLDRVHELCRYSIEATSLDLYLDTPARERGPYEGDTFVNQLSQYACERSYALARVSNQYLSRRPTWPAEYHLMPVLVAWEDYLATGDDAQLRSDVDLWRRANYDHHLGADGLVHKDPGSSSAWDADLVDWPQTCRDDYEFTSVNTVLNAFQAAAHEALARICTVLGQDAEVGHHAALAARMRAGIEAHLVREDGTYRDGLGSEHSAQHATAIPVALGLAPAERHDVHGEALAAGGMRMSVYGAQFLLDALFTLGRADEAHALMTSRGQRGWLHLLDDLGASIVPEAWDPSLKPNMTYSHAWGTAPVNVIARWVLGVRVVAAGAARLEIVPQPGPLSRMEGTVPTIRGDVHVRYDRSAATLDVQIPANVTALVRFGTVEQEIGPGATTLTLT